MWKKVGKSLAKRLGNIRYHYDDIGNDGSTNRTADRVGETATASTESDASREPEQYNVCGKPGCHCKDAKNPQKHGPYNQLSFTRRGQGGTRFVAGRATGGDAAETPAGGAMCDFRCQKMRCSLRNPRLKYCATTEQSARCRRLGGRESPLRKGHLLELPF